MKSFIFIIFVFGLEMLNGYEEPSWSSSIINSAKEFMGKKTIITLTKEQRYNQVWNSSLNRFKEASELELQLEKAPEASWKFWQRDKDDIKEDIDRLINEIISKIANVDLLEYKEKIKKYRDKINSLKEDIAQLREKKLIDISSNRALYETKIDNLKEQIKALDNEIKNIHKSLKKSFRANNIKLNAKQIDVLLDRVDGDDIIQMTVIIDILKYINKQIATLVKESGEDLERAKKYYAMHLVSLQIVVNIQQKYIDKVVNIYIPKLDEIEKKTLKIKSETEIKIDKEKSIRRKRVYENNLKAQNLTLKVIKIYKEHLKRAILNIKEAQDISYKNLELADNTLKTVLLSSDLYNTISESKGLFNKVISIQIPNIIPFENLQIKKEFKNLTLQLSK